jgi:hypothetical protein
VKWLSTAWQLARDILLTGTGLWLIISQVGARDPSSALIVAGLALTVPAAATHAAAVLSGPSSPTQHGQPPSSEPAPPPASLPSSPPGGGTDGQQRRG